MNTASSEKSIRLDTSLIIDGNIYDSGVLELGNNEELDVSGESVRKCINNHPITSGAVSPMEHERPGPGLLHMRPG